MGKVRIKKGQEWLHVPSNTTYKVLSLGKIKIPHVGWFKSVTYQCSEGKCYSRFIEDFENKFKKIEKVKSNKNE